MNAPTSQTKNLPLETNGGEVSCDQQLATREPYQFQWLEPKEVDQPVIDEWDGLVGSSDSWYQLYQSPEWWSYLHLTRLACELRLAIVRDANSHLVAVAPVSVVSRRFALGGVQRRLPFSRFRSWELLGGEPLVQPGVLFDRVYAELLEGILRHSAGHGVYCKSVREVSSFGHWIRNSACQSRFYSITEHGPRHLLGIQMTVTLEDYLRKFSGKTRSTLRRKTKLLELGQGPVTLTRVERPEQIADFLQRATRVSQNSWQFRKDGPQILNSAEQIQGLEHLARLGMLRSYLLSSGTKDGAFCLGYQFNGVYHYANLGFDQNWTAWSPGIVLLTEILRDLWTHRTPVYMNFGVGEAEYKRRFSNIEMEDRSVLFTRPGWVNWAWWGLHCRLAELKKFAHGQRSAR